ncbi:MAG: NPCBM/NEW2 domain-containing protein [Planctomycetes bacterium]|nr:NPCBM/NEW2 domain-containing protein [Planctomycetota bacterium]
MAARSLRTASALALLAVAAAVAPATAAPARRSAEVVRLDGDPVRGPFASIGADGIRLEGAAAPIALDEVRVLRWSDAAAGPTAHPPGGAPADASGTRLLVVLRGDEMLRGRLRTGDDEGLELEPDGLPPVRIPFEQVRRVERDGPDRGPCDEPGRAHLPRPGSDVAWTTAGDAYVGTLAGADADGVAIEQGGARRTVRWGDLVVLHVDEPALAPAEGLVAEVETSGGTRLVATSVEGDASTWTVRTRTGLSVPVPVAAVAAVRWRGGRFVYLSDLPYASTFEPYYADDLLDAKTLERWYGARTDRTPSGCPLRVAGVTYRHGVAVHARSTLRVALDGAYTRFQAQFGVDDEALAGAEGSRGDVVARVLVDGREAWTSGGSVRGGEAARVVGPVDLGGAKELVLEVGFGGDQHRMDRADWLDPVLVRAR